MMFFGLCLLQLMIINKEEKKGKYMQRFERNKELVRDECWSIAFLHDIVRWKDYITDQTLDARDELRNIRIKQMEAEVQQSAHYFVRYFCCSLSSFVSSLVLPLFLCSFVPLSCYTNLSVFLFPTLYSGFDSLFLFRFLFIYLTFLLLRQLCLFQQQPLQQWKKSCDKCR